MSDETVDLQAYNDFMCWEDTQDNMDQSLFHFFPELELEPTFSRVMTGLDTRTHLIPAGLQPTDIMITGTTHDPASIFGEDFVTEETLIDIPAINTLPVTKIQSRKIFCDTLTQKPSYIVLHVVEPITPITRSNRRKRKSSGSDDEDDEYPPETKDYHGQDRMPMKKTEHNVIEKRYRTKLNDKITTLRDCVPSLRVTRNTEAKSEVKKQKEDVTEELQGSSPAHKLNKATILSKAAEYILHLEKNNEVLCKEHAAYEGRIETFEILMLTTKNSNTTITMTTNTPPVSATSSLSAESSYSGSGSLNRRTNATSLSKSGI
ncbi:helix-loop-helix DNA-binding domain-containing protein [Xylogone sp. PMI_703]|nr:helix-loop-helix DNA-binding domain-containing protein [Xylogone sp. PMI_703]